MKKNKILKNLIYAAMFTVLTAAFAQIIIPIGPVPISLSLIPIYICSMCMSVKYSVLSQVVYLLLGAVGVPVFSAFGAGLGKILGPTGGYIFSYIAVAAIVSIFSNKFGNKLIFNIIGLTLGLILCYSIGTLWYVATAGVSVSAALMSCVIPFIPGDIAKIVLSIIIARILKRYKLFT